MSGPISAVKHRSHSGPPMAWWTAEKWSIYFCFCGCLTGQGEGDKDHMLEMRNFWLRAVRVAFVTFWAKLHHEQYTLPLLILKTGSVHVRV